MHKTGRAGAAIDLAALVILCAETALMAVIVVGYVVYALLGSSSSGLGWGIAAVAAILAAGLAVFTWGFARKRRFALGGAVTWQLMQASVGVWVLATLPGVGVALIVCAVVVIVAIFRRQAALGARDADAPSD